jgi:prolyl-tRNA editing enzyme YbaK/EbsC (Cys-tRNA(Pro) deacylase)
MDPLTPAAVQAAIDERGLDVDMTLFEETTATSQQAADQIGCQLGQIVKSIAFLIDGEPLLVLASGDGRVDDKKLAKRFEVGRKKVKIAKPEQMVEIWGYPPGSMPPFGHRKPNMRILIDESLQRFETVYAAGGAHNAIFGVKLAALVESVDGTYADVRKEA